MEQRTKTYRTAMYLRLSKDDGDIDGREKAESNSIANQRDICRNYIDRQKDLKLVGEYADDGFTGMNFDRPDMKRMMADVDAGKIDCIVVKDLSRFGRERIETGTYISKTFKAKGIRFIAINDNYDTLTADGSETNIVMPIKALTNDSFSRDISVKVRSSQSVKREKGQFIGAFAPYGYKKSEDDRNVLVPDDYAAGIVKTIFARKLEGMAANSIADSLNEEGVLSPSEYKRNNGQKYQTGFRSGRDARWSAQTVLRILKNEVYTGTMAQGKRERISYKVRRDVVKPSSQWVRVNDTHKAVVDRRTFDCVQALLERDTIRTDSAREPYLFSGLLYCADCGMSMVRRTYEHGSRVEYICSNYNRNHACSRHSIREDVLKEAVLDGLKSVTDALCNTVKLRAKLDEMNFSFESAVDHDAEIARLREELAKCSALKSSLYQDLKDGLINEEQFRRYRDDFTNREMNLKSAIEEQEKLVRDIYDKGVACGVDLEKFRMELSIGELDRALLVTLVDRILIHGDGSVEIVTRFAAPMQKLDSIMESAGFRPADAAEERMAG